MAEVLTSSTVAEDLEASLPVAEPKPKKKAKGKAKRAQKYDVRGHRVRPKRTKDESAAPPINAPRPPRERPVASAMLAMARPLPENLRRPEKLEPLKEQEVEEPEKQLDLEEIRQPSTSRSLARSKSGVLSPLRRDIPVPRALNPSSFQRRARPMEASTALRQLQEKIESSYGYPQESKKSQLEQVALRDLRSELGTMLKRSSTVVKLEPSRSVDDVFSEREAKREVKRVESQPCLSRPSSTSSSMPPSPQSVKSALRRGTQMVSSRALGEGVSFESPEESEPLGTGSTSNALMRSAMARKSVLGGSDGSLKGRSAALKNMANTEAILRARLVDAFNRLADAKELHRDNVPAALGLVGWAVTKEIRTLLYEAYDSLFKFSTINQNEFMHVFAKFRQLEKQKAKEAFNQFDSDFSGTIDFDELSSLFQSQGIFPLQHVIYELAMEACDGNLTDGLDFSAFQRVLEILREREGFTREERAFFQDVFDKCDGDGSGTLDTLEIGRVLVTLGYSKEMKFAEILAQVDIQQKNQLTKQDFLVFMRKIRERDTEHIRNYFRECDTDGEPGLDAREIASLIQSLGYLPDMTCILETLQQLGIDNPEQDLDFEEVWRFLEIYRRQSGLTVSAVQEAKETFRKFSGEITVSVDMMFQMLRSLGFNLHYHEVRKLMYLVEGNASGVMNEQEFICAVGHLKHTELRQMWKVVHQEPTSDAARDLKKQFQKDLGDADKVSFMDFIPWATRLRGWQREVVKGQHGFGKAEVDAFKEDFHGYARGNAIRPLDLRRLLTSKFPMLADKNAMKDHRAKLSEVLAEKGPVKLLEFLALARICHDIIELDKLKKERQTIEETRFSSAEVDEFRSLFMEQAGSSGLPGSYQHRISVQALKRLLENVVPMGDGNVQVMRKHLSMAQKYQGTDAVSFTEFLRLMRRLLDVNFAGIAEIQGKRSLE